MSERNGLRRWCGRRWRLPPGPSSPVGTVPLVNQVQGSSVATGAGFPVLDPRGLMGVSFCSELRVGTLDIQRRPHSPACPWLPVPQRGQEAGGGARVPSVLRVLALHGPHCGAGQQYL